MRIYSEINECMIPKSVQFRGHKWIWNESDAVYYREDTDEEYIGFCTAIEKGVY